MYHGKNTERQLFEMCTFVELCKCIVWMYSVAIWTKCDSSQRHLLVLCRMNAVYVRWMLYMYDECCICTMTWHNRGVCLYCATFIIDYDECQHTTQCYSKALTYDSICPCTCQHLMIASRCASTAFCVNLHWFTGLSQNQQHDHPQIGYATDTTTPRTHTNI